ncbi:hypothetical protein QQF64_022990 [Cirrhinus molitorella]|uniref:Uncharacterized protein n=1 Tax=Cirrhinus molitorella TaxID=172907 RepID=A0ABR3L7A9_9TELE
MNIDVPLKITPLRNQRGHGVFGQLFILLQYQTLVNWLKVLILKADNPTNHTPEGHLLSVIGHVLVGLEDNEEE